jgi:hypothetical protein
MFLNLSGFQKFQMSPAHTVPYTHLAAHASSRDITEHTIPLLVNELVIFQYVMLEVTSIVREMYVTQRRKGDCLLAAS